MHDDDLTREERAALDALPRERDPGPLLEERTVRALRARGLLGRGERIARPVFTPAWASAAAAAAIALFISGFTVGHWIQSRHTEQLLVSMHERDAAHTAALVQRTGSAYVAALAALADAADSSRVGGRTAGRDLTQGREVAVSILHAAANQLIRIAPEEPLAARILQGLDRAAARDSTLAGSDQQVIWF